METNLTPIDLNDRVIDAHRLLRGIDRRKAIKRFLDQAGRIRLYGIDAHPVTIENSPWVLGVDAKGIISFTREQFNSQMDGRRIKWSEIKEFRYRENRFTLVTKTTQNVFTYTVESTTKGKGLTQKKILCSLKLYNTMAALFWEETTVGYGVTHQARKFLS